VIPRNVTRGEAVAWSVIAAYLLLGVWGVLIAAGRLPAAPWSPIGQAHQHSHHQHRPPAARAQAAQA
jgi:hypothetical protein